MKILITTIVFVFASWAAVSSISKNDASFSELVGKYENANYNRIERLLQRASGISSRIGGTIISINSDTTFNLISCANIMNGKWAFDSDSIYLFVEANVWKNDSLQEFGFNGTWPTISEKPMTFQIKGNELRTIYNSVRNKKKHQSLQYLKKTSPNKK